MRKKPAIRKPRRDDRPLWDVVFSVYGAPAVLLAHKLGIFPFLANKPRTFTEICKHLEIAARPAETILAANAALGFVKLKGGRYALTPLSEDYLLESGPTYFGRYFDLIINNYPVCSIESLEKAEHGTALRDSGKTQPNGPCRVCSTAYSGRRANT